ncbi:MAG: hypothetical protein ACLTMP_07265 [Eggerthella lenta]
MLRLILPKIVRGWCRSSLVCVFPVDYVGHHAVSTRSSCSTELIDGEGGCLLQHEEYQRLSNHFIDSMRGIDTPAFRPRQAARAAHLRGERALPRGNG